MSEVYIVESCWDSQDSSPDNWYNCSEHGIDAVFSTREKAIEYIRSELKDELENGKDKEELTYTEETFPTNEQILKDFTYRDGWFGINWYSIVVMEVDVGV